jgi:hypothetical protein
MSPFKEGVASRACRRRFAAFQTFSSICRPGYSFEISRSTMTEAVRRGAMARLALRVTHGHLEEELVMAAS